MIDIYFEAGAKIGMGHLLRSARLYRYFREKGQAGAFYGQVDSVARRFAKDLGLHFDKEFSRMSETVVIDAINIPKSDEKQLSNFKNRFALVELQNHLKLPTEYFLRSGSATLENQEKTVVVDPRFILTEVGAPASEIRSYASIHIGICLTAGDSLGERVFVDSILGWEGVERVFLISRDTPVVERKLSAKIEHRTPGANPWNFLRDINVFLGGNGLMLGEAINRGIPTFMASNAAGRVKNAALVDAEVVAPVGNDKVGAEHLVNMLKEADKLSALREAALRFRNSGSEFPLARAIATAAGKS